MNPTARTQSILAELRTADPNYLEGALRAVAQGTPGAVDELSERTGVAAAELRAAARAFVERELDQRFQKTGESKLKSSVGRDQPEAFRPGEHGINPAGLIALQFGARDDVASLAVTGVSPAPTAGSSPRLRVPSLSEVEAIRAGDLDAASTVQALKVALLSAHPQDVKQAARTLQVIESYARKAAQDHTNYAGTGFTPFTFPEVELSFAKDELDKLADAVARTRDPETADILLMAERRGLIGTEPQGSLSRHGKLVSLATGASGELAASDGVERPRGGAKSFHDEWVNEVEPGMRNIREAIIQTAAARGAGCPYAHGNHAKGIEFENVSMKTAEAAPAWVKELFGASKSGGMIRLSGSQTNPDEPDSEPHQPGLRVVIPIAGRLEDGSATQILDLTANAGSTTHAKTAARHTQFTKTFSVPREGLLGLRPLRAAGHVFGGVFKGRALERAGEMRSALGSSGKANEELFHEHDLYARHAYFIGGRYVQIRMKVIEPQDFPDPRGDPRPNARLDVVQQTVADRGMKIAMYVTELPQGRAEMAEQEGWKGLEGTEYLAATFTVPPQNAAENTSAATYMREHPFVPAGPKMVATGVGLGRHRAALYEFAGNFRQQPRPSE